VTFSGPARRAGRAGATFAWASYTDFHSTRSRRPDRLLDRRPRHALRPDRVLPRRDPGPPPKLRRTAAT